MYRGADKSLAQPDWKNSWKVAIFYPTRRSLLLRRPGWTDNLLNFFWMACKSQSLVTVAFFPGRAKDLSAPRYNCNHQADFCPTEQCMAKMIVTVGSAAMYFWNAFFVILPTALVLTFHYYISKTIGWYHITPHRHQEMSINAYAFIPSRQQFYLLHIFIPGENALSCAVVGTHTNLLTTLFNTHNIPYCSYIIYQVSFTVQELWTSKKSAQDTILRY
jgi:hypothetical protein